MKARKFRWLVIDPFGRPVVPEVNRIAAGSSSAIGVVDSGAWGAWATMFGEVVLHDHDGGYRGRIRVDRTGGGR